MVAVTSRRQRWIATLVVAGLPAALLCIGVARYTLHHFYYRAPFLLDSGWYASIIYHSGIVPHNPVIACNYADTYFGVHFSPLVSVFSLLSYLSPLGRIEWYALFQALVFLPIALATYIVASRVKGALVTRTLPVTMLAAVAFALCGQVIWLVGYPHYEAAIPGLICMTLGAAVTGRIRLAWVCLAMAAMVREDGGLHTALALSPLVYLKWRGVPMPPTIRVLLRMCAVAIAASFVGIVAQKLFFHSANLLRAEYFGTPFYAHLNASLLADRSQKFLETRQLFYYPFLATTLVAMLRRDPRYLLGWAATLPWFLLNFTAIQPDKGLFSEYTGFPFLVSMFWVYLYGLALAPEPRRLGPGVIAALFAIVSTSSTLGFFRAGAGTLKFIAKDMAYRRPMNRSAVQGFVRAIEQHREQLGRFYIDSAVAALATDAFPLEAGWHKGVPADAIAFHRATWAQSNDMIGDLLVNQLDTCFHPIGTELYLCTTQSLSFEPLDGTASERIPSVFVFSRLPRDAATVLHDGILVQPGGALKGMLGTPPAGTYQLSVDSTPAAHDATGTTELEVIDEYTSVALGSAPAAAPSVPTVFASKGDRVLVFYWRNKSSSSVLLRDVHLRKL